MVKVCIAISNETLTRIEKMIKMGMNEEAASSVTNLVNGLETSSKK